MSYLLSVDYGVILNYLAREIQVTPFEAVDRIRNGLFDHATHGQQLFLEKPEIASKLVSGHDDSP